MQMQTVNVPTNPKTDCTCRWNGESWEDYFIRLCENKDKYEITYREIAGLLNNENGESYDESTYRKRFAYFNMGRKYEREHNGTYVAERVLSISDLHVPYNYPVNIFSKYMGQVDILVLNGDIMDCQSISFFPKKYRISIVEEMVNARQYIMDLIDMIKPRKVIIVKGNHEHRMLRYLSSALNEDILSLMPDSPMDLIINDGFKNIDRYKRTEVYYPSLKKIYAEKGIEINYDGNWFTRVGNVIFAHPLSYSSSIMKTLEKATNYFMRTLKHRDFTAIVMGHTHKVGFYKLGDVTMYEQGCCCKLDLLDYADGKLQNPQQNGYIYLSLNSDGDIIEDKTRLVTVIN